MTKNKNPAQIEREPAQSKVLKEGKHRNIKEFEKMDFFSKLLRSIGRIFTDSDFLLMFIVLSVGAVFITYQYVSRETTSLIIAITIVYVILLIKKYKNYYK